jgi:hypothetical protein
MGRRTLDRLEAVAEKGRGLAAAADKRSRLPDAVDALVRAPMLTPKALAARNRAAVRGDKLDGWRVNLDG